MRNSKFKCRACDVGYGNKKSYERHRKSPEHIEKTKMTTAEELMKMYVDFSYAMGTTRPPVSGPAIPGQVHTVSWMEPWT